MSLEVKRSKVKVTRLRKPSRSHAVASDACCYSRVLLLPAWVCMSIRLPMFSSYNWSRKTPPLNLKMKMDVHIPFFILSENLNSDRHGLQFSSVHFRFFRRWCSRRAPTWMFLRRGA